jgi:dTDP-4-amino-4,6-dideoxygalactose transaminase
MIAAAKMSGPGYKIPFAKPFLMGKELHFIAQAVHEGKLSGDGSFTRRCNRWLEEKLGARRALLTHSCTAALEMAALLAGVGADDEVIMPSFTFVSTANAFVLRGAKPVFVDIRPDTLNIDENQLEAALSPRSRAIAVVHYGGIGCNMALICDFARKHGLRVIEDAAHAFLARYRGSPLGAVGDLGCLSFHETKNVISGEGGALVVQDDALAERAEILWEKGTNRRAFFKGQVDKYTWIDVGSSFLPSELTAAFLYAQFEQAALITERRRSLCTMYRERLASLEARGLATLSGDAPGCETSGHVFYLLTRTPTEREALLTHLRSRGILALSHYVPLHSSPAGRRLGRAVGALPVTDRVSATLVRLPLFYEMTDAELDLVCDEVCSWYAAGCPVG